MPIGPITPGSFVTVTPDVIGAPYASLQAPTATMPVVGSDLQALTLVTLNIQDYVLGELVSTAATKLDKIAGGTVSGATVFSGDVNFTLTADFVSGDLTFDATSTFSSAGTNVFASGSDTSVDGTAVLRTTNGGKFRWDTRNKSPAADYTADGTNGYEDILPDPPTDRAITLATTGAAIGQRKKFNAQAVTSFQWVLGATGRTWNLKNATGFTVKIEFVYDGSGWVVDDWEEGGNALRNG
jgi:hypothetical protein